MATINETTNSVAAVWHSCTGGKFILQITMDNGRNRRFANVLDDNGKVIGSAHDSIYSDGWAVHTAPYGGYVPESSIIYAPPAIPARPIWEN